MQGQYSLDNILSFYTLFFKCLSCSFSMVQLFIVILKLYFNKGLKIKCTLYLLMYFLSVSLFLSSNVTLDLS